MDYSADSSRAALLLTNRLVPVDAKPLTAREFWQLVARVDPGELLNEDARGIAARLAIDNEEARRLRTLLDASTALGFEQDRLQEGGVSLISALDDAFPRLLQQRLGAACPPFLLVAGPIDWLQRPGLGVVGSRDADEGVLEVARQSAVRATKEGWPVVSGLARGVDQVAMAAAMEARGVVVGVPAEGILKASRNTEIRRRVHEGQLCIASPYAPNAPFQAGNTMGRNKLIYALSRITFVVASDKDKGGTWAGASEALERGYAPVAVWTGDGAKEGNVALVKRGATPISEIEELFALDYDVSPPPLQETLF